MSDKQNKHIPECMSELPAERTISFWAISLGHRLTQGLVSILRSLTSASDIS